MAFSQDDQAVACCKSHLASPHAALEALPGTSSSGIYLRRIYQYGVTGKADGTHDDRLGPVAFGRENTYGVG